MMIARWQFEAKFGRKQEAIALSRQWDQEIGKQTKFDVDNARMLTGSVGAREGVVQIDFPIKGLGELQDFFDAIAKIKMHEEWGKQMGEVVVSGSTFWEVFRIVE